MFGLLFPDFLPVLTIAVVILFLPRRYFLHVIGWLAIPIVLIAIEVGHPPGWQSQNVGYTLGLVAIIFAGAIIGAAVLAKALVIAAWAKWRGEPIFAELAGELGPRLAGPKLAQTACWGVLSAFLACLALRSLLAPTNHAAPAAFVFLAFVISLWLVPKLLSREPGALTLSPAGRLFLESFRWSVVAAVAFGVSMAWHVTREVRAIAGDEPYCVQVAHSTYSTYRQAETWLDLSALTMKGAGQFHGLLAVGGGLGQRVFNWSYRQFAFQELPASRNPDRFQPFLSCEPRQFFAEGLGFFFGESSDTAPVFFANRKLRIPNEYQPRLPGVYGRQFFISAIAPEFRTIEPEDKAGSGFARTAVNVWLRPSISTGLWADLSEDERILSEEAVYGLDMQTIARPDPYAPYARYLVRDPAGGFEALIRCGPPDAPGHSTCLHQVRNGNVLFRFRHRHDELAEWRSMQERLFALFDSFLVEPGPDTPTFMPASSRRPTLQ